MAPEQFYKQQGVRECTPLLQIQHDLFSECLLDRFCITRRNLGIYTFFYSNFSHVGIWCGFAFGPGIPSQKIGQMSAAWNLSKKMVPQMGALGGGTFALFKRISLPPKRGKGSCNNSAGSKCIANQAKRPGFQHRVCNNLRSWNYPQGLSQRW